MIIKRFLRSQLKQTYIGADLAGYVESALLQVRILPEFIQADTILAYKPLPDEIPFILPLREAFPEKEWVMIAPDAKIEDVQNRRLKTSLLAIVPARALDSKGNRLGRGGGFYDRLLAYLQNQHIDFTSVSVVPDFTFFDSVPTEPHDVSVDIAVVATTQ